jgi:DNA-binding transcriptional regulator YhcF (GntR family)
MRIQIDRDLPVPVGTQVQGQIEYGVSIGDFPAGSQLPSVRELATELGVSPVTVSQVYKALQAKGLIETVPGRGTFVRDVEPETGARGSVSRVDELLRAALRAAEREGLGRAELLERFQRLLALGRSVAPIRVVFVGVYRAVTRAYVADLQRHLRPFDALTAVTFDDVAADPAARRELAEADLALTFAHRRSELQALVPSSTQVATVKLIPSERTRVALAEIDPLAQLVLISTVPEFLPTFRRAVERFASQVESVRAALLGTAEAADLIAEADVVVYGTGSEAVLDGLPGNVRSFEYRHVPDPIHVERALLPLVEAVRGRAAHAHYPQEAL